MITLESGTRLAEVGALLLSTSTIGQFSSCCSVQNSLGCLDGGNSVFLRRAKVQLLGHQELGSKDMTHSLKTALQLLSSSKSAHALTPDLTKYRAF